MAWGAIKRTTADDWFSKCIRLAQDYRCERCTTQGGPTAADVQMQCCHIIGRRNQATRYSVWNALCMCVNCHRETGENVRDFKVWVANKFGQGRIDRIEINARGILKPTKQNLKMISDHYRLEFHRMTKTGARDLQTWN